MTSVQFDNVIIGEPEITFKVDENNFVNLWIGSFDMLMKLGQPSKTGKWNDFLQHYHMNDGFYDEVNWIVPYPVDYLHCVNNISIPSSYENKAEANIIKEVLSKLFTYAIERNLDVVIDYF